MRAGAIVVTVVVLLTTWGAPEAAANKKPWLGVVIATNCPVHVAPDGRTYKSPGCHDGVRVERILADTPAQRANLRPFDVITRVSGVAVTQAADLINEITTKHQVGDVAVLDVVRGGRQIRVQATLDAMLSASEMFAKKHVGNPAPEVGHLGRVSGAAISSAVADHRGDVVVVYLFARLCSGCAAISRVVDELHVAHGDRGLAVLALGEEQPGVLAKLAREQKLRMPVFADPFQRARRSLEILQGRLPAVLVIGRDNIVRYAALGDEVDPAELRAAVDRAMRRTAAVR